jgi:2-dehydro-3-deoxygluconokinase
MTRSGLCTLGEAMIRLSPPSGKRLSTAISFDASVGGAELNVAIASAALGTPASWLSSLPVNPLAERIVRSVRAADVTPVIAPSTDRVGLYFVEVGAEPRGVSVVYDRQDSAFSNMVALDQRMRSTVETASVVYTSGITLALGGNGPRLVDEFFGLANHALKYFEINHRSKLWSAEEAREATMRVLPAIDVLVASEHDLTELLGINQDPIAAAHLLISDFDYEFVLIPSRKGRVGEEGVNTVTVVTPEGDFRAECAGRVVDPVGAGDAGTGTFIAIYAQTGDLKQAAEASARASAHQQTELGDAASFLPDEILQPSEQRIRR